MNKQYSTRWPVKVLMEILYYSVLESRSASDFIRHSVRLHLDYCRKKHGAIPDATQKKLLDRINDGDRLDPIDRSKLCGAKH